jgi:steroid delta-isomerase-like uncharacterized protein
MGRKRWVLISSLLLLLLGGCTHSQNSALEKNKALVNSFGQASNARNFDAIREMLVPDFVRHCQATPEVLVQNRDQFIEYLKADAKVFPDSRQTLQHIVAEGDLVAFSLTYEGTQEGQMGPFPASHKKMQLDVLGMFRVHDGKLAELWVTWDNLAGLGQLGHFPPPAAAKQCAA